MSMIERYRVAQDTDELAAVLASFLEDSQAYGVCRHRIPGGHELELVGDDRPNVRIRIVDNDYEDEPQPE